MNTYKDFGELRLYLKSNDELITFDYASVLIKRNNVKSNRSNARKKREQIEQNRRDSWRDYTEVALQYSPFRLHAELLDFSDDQLHPDFVDFLDSPSKSRLERFGDDIYRVRIFSENFMTKV